MFYFLFITPFFNHWDVHVVLVLIKSYTHCELSMHRLLKWHFHITPVAFYFWFITLNYFIKFLYTWEHFMFSLLHAPVALIPPPVVLSTLPPPLNVNLGLSMPHHILSAGASPPVCLSFAVWLLCRILSRSYFTCPSLTPLLRSCQLNVHLFAPPPPINRGSGVKNDIFSNCPHDQSKYSDPLIISQYDV